MSGKSFFSFLAGAAIGAAAAAWFLSSPEKREELKQKAGDLGEQAKNKAGEAADTIRETVSKGLDALEDALDKKMGRE